MYAPPHYPAPPPPRRSIWIWLGPFIGVVGIVSLVAMVSLVRFCGRAADAGGVRASNEITKPMLDGLAKRNILQPNEKVLAYYDATVSGDASELALVTSERLIYVTDGRTTSMAVADIADVKSRTEPLTGDIIEAQSDSGELLKVEIAPMNGGPTFLSALELARKNKRAPK